MMKIARHYKWIICLLSGLILSSCIENDIPYPIVAGDILSMEVEGQISVNGTNAVTINKTNYTVSISVNDSVDLTKLKIKRLTVSGGASLIVDSAVCVNYAKFPTNGFASLDSLPVSANTRMNFAKAVPMILRTYQDYTWKIKVTQYYDRAILVQNQIGDAVIDENTHQAIVYVAANQPLDQIKVEKMNLGGAYGEVIPNPLTYTDFSDPVSFTVFQNGKTDNGVKWTVYVFHSDEDSSSSSTSSAFVTTNRATVSGSIQNGKVPEVEYKKQTTGSKSDLKSDGWIKLSASAVNVNGTSFTATISDLDPGTTYTYRILVDSAAGTERSFKTASVISLINGSFDEWSQDANNPKLWCPWIAGSTSFWDTGNRGAVTVGNSNSVPTDETYTGSGKAAQLESKYILIKFAAGNIFTGSYLNTEGTNGILSFGREFNSFPTKLRMHYKYTSKIIDKSNDDAYAYLKGRSDSCHIYIALTDWSAPIEIRTKPTNRQLFDKNDKHIIAYAEFISGQSTANYQRLDLPLVYRYADRTPKYILIVATSSKYGDYFTGGVGSTLWVDNFELLYD